ncbi:MAG: PAS domain-containing sensor histidine kinase [Candidatus Thorarchaeota archaeon]
MSERENKDAHDAKRGFVLGDVHLSEIALEEIINNAHSAVVIVSDDFKFEYSSAEGDTIFGGATKDLIGHDFREWMSADVAEFVGTRYLERLSGKSPPVSYPIKIFRKDGSVRDVRIRSSLITGIDGKKKILVHVLDITDEKKYHEALEDSERRYRTLIETMNDGLAIDDSEGRLTYVNQAFCDMIGFSQSEIIGHTWLDFTRTKDAAFMETKRDERMAGKSEHYELEWETKTGAIIPTIISATPNYNSENVFVGTFAVITQISAQKEAEDTVQFYLDLLTHDVANQLQVIITAAGLIDPELPAQYIEDSRQDILDAVERCNRLITKVKRAGEIRNIPHTSIDLSEVVHDKVAVLERIYNAKVECEGITGEICVNADALLGELLWNLLENAARHNPKSDKKVWINGRKKNGMFEISISDNGSGIGTERKATIFDKSRRSGGVGLTLVAQMARKYGGNIQVIDRIDGKPNMGAKFVLSLILSSIPTK